MLSLYVHFPFCIKKCSYCAFNSYELPQIDYNDWLSKYKKALAFFAQKTNEKNLASIYFGGGTPSLMPDFMVYEIINYANKLFCFENNLEVSLEANPNTINQKTVNSFKQAGINRISLGIQSLDDNDLTYLGRIHNTKQALDAIAFSQNLFDNISIDLIYGLPNQSLKSWQQILEQALALNLSHYSLYQLSIEPNSKFYDAKVKLEDEEKLANLFEMNQFLMLKANLTQYEVSNYAVSGKECRHNVLCWQGYDYIGIGAGACGRINNYATMQNLNPKLWFDNPENSEIEKLDAKTRADELLILGLRMLKGVDLKLFSKNCSYDLLNIIDQKALNSFIDDKLLQFEHNILAPTPKALLVLDYILKKLII